jgi:DUF1680 family protein
MMPEGDGFSYVNLLNGVKTNKQGWGTDIEGIYMTCCNLNGPEGLAYLPLVAIMQRDNGAVVNLYSPATAQIAVAAPDTRARLTIESQYPREGDIRIEVVPDRPVHFVLEPRIPGWSQATQLKVNQQPVDVRPGTYARIDRRWSPGDVVTLGLDMRCRLIKAPRGSHQGSDRFRALMRGPIVLARDENVDSHFAEPVEIVHADGIVDAKPVEPSVSTTALQFEVPVRGGTIQMVDYASVNSWEGKRVQTWLPLPVSQS